MNIQTKPKSFSLQHQNPQQPKLYDQLQQIYNKNAQYNKQQAKNFKHLYSKIIQKNQQQKEVRKQIEKKINQFENQQIDIFWKNRETELQARQRQHKRMIEQIRMENQKIVDNKILSKSMVTVPNNQTYLNQYYEDQINYEKRKYIDRIQKQRFLAQGKAINEYKNYQKHLERQKIMEQERKKLVENDQIQHKKIQQMDRWRKKYLQFHNQQAYDVWDQNRKAKLEQEDALENYIVNQGAIELNQRTQRMKNQVFERQQSKRQNFIRELHSQLQDSQSRALNTVRNQKQQQKRLIDQRNQYIAQKDRIARQIQNEQNKQHLSVIKSQMKPKNIQPEKEQVSYPGMASPVNIGKTLADDRRKQLEWLQRNLNRQLIQ